MFLLFACFCTTVLGLLSDLHHQRNTNAHKHSCNMDTAKVKADQLLASLQDAGITVTGDWFLARYSHLLLVSASVCLPACLPIPGAQCIHAHRTKPCRSVRTRSLMADGTPSQTSSPLPYHTIPYHTIRYARVRFSFVGKMMAVPLTNNGLWFACAV